jgi:hypothetical protein
VGAGRSALPPSGISVLRMSSVWVADGSADGKCVCEGGHPRLQVTTDSDGAQISVPGGHLLALPKQTCPCKGHITEEVGLHGQGAWAALEQSQITSLQ